MEKTTPKWKYGSDIQFISLARLVNTVFLHCSASDDASHDDVSVMKRWHMVDNKWPRVGYHYFINKNGDVQEGCQLEQLPIAQKGYNTGSIVICLHGLKKSKFTAAQLESVKKLCKSITDSYDKKIRIRGHKEVSNKSCPVFDYKTTLGLNAEGYYNGNGTETTTVARVGTSEADNSTIAITKKVQPISLMNKGQHVKALQGLLTKFGFACAKDGVFGHNTAAKVMLYQRKNGLPVDGVVGPKTIDAMFSNKSLILKKMSKGVDVEVFTAVTGDVWKKYYARWRFWIRNRKSTTKSAEITWLKSGWRFWANKSRKNTESLN